MGAFKQFQTLSHFGVWILLSLCPPHAEINEVRTLEHLYEKRAGMKFYLILSVLPFIMLWIK